MSEYAEQCKVVQYLHILQSQNKIDFYTAIPNSTYTTSWSQKNKNRASGLQPGLCDLMIIIDGVPYFIEMKFKGNTLSAAQKHVIKVLNKNQTYQAFVCYSFEEAKLIIDDMVDPTPKRFIDTQYFKNQGKGCKALIKLLDIKL